MLNLSKEADMIVKSIPPEKKAYVIFMYVRDNNSGFFRSV